MNSLHDIPGSHFGQNKVPLVAIGTDKTYAVCFVPFNAIIVSVKKIFDVAITGADTNYFITKLINGGQAGAGTTLIASKSYVNGVDAEVLVPETLTLEAAANLVLTAGDILLFLSDQSNGNGLQEEAGTMFVEFKAR